MRESKELNLICHPHQLEHVLRAIEKNHLYHLIKTQGQMLWSGLSAPTVHYGFISYV